MQILRRLRWLSGILISTMRSKLSTAGGFQEDFRRILPLGIEAFAAYASHHTNFNKQNSTMNFLKILLVGVAAIVLSTPLSAQQLTPAERERIEAVFEGLVEEGEPGYAVGIVREGQTVFEAYDGLANISHGVSIGPDTRINIASVAKQYVALMTLELVARGEIDLEADFRSYLLDAMPNIQEKISIANLLSHTSGVRDHVTLRALMGVTWYERPFNNRTAMRLLNAQEELNFAPGSDYLYSNSNYILLAEVIAEVTQERFDDYARSFFDRIDMPDSGWKRRYGDALPNEARGYMNFNGWIENPQIANYFGDGFLFTTLPDQLAWERQLQGIPSSLPSEVVERSQTRLGADMPGNYGFGLEFGSFADDRSIYQVGSTGGYNAYTLRLPERHISIVVMLNTAQIGSVQLGNQLAAALLDVPMDQVFSYSAGPEELLNRPAYSDVTGRYELQDGTIIKIAERDGILFREIEGSSPVALVHEEGNFFVYSSNAQLKMAFELANSGAKKLNIYLPTQPVQIGHELEALPDSDIDRASLKGCYFNSETRTEIEIDWIDGDNFLMIKNGRSRDAKMLSANYLRWNNYRLRFERGGEENVARLWVDNGRIRNVRFDPTDKCHRGTLGRFIPQ
jgi:CubicO group peptidase (beta-lactamase class C family)